MQKEKSAQRLEYEANCNRKRSFASAWLAIGSVVLTAVANMAHYPHVEMGSEIALGLIASGTMVCERNRFVKLSRSRARREPSQPYTSAEQSHLITRRNLYTR